jgi:hypothetical protein
MDVIDYCTSRKKQLVVMPMHTFSGGALAPIPEE